MSRKHTNKQIEELKDSARYNARFNGFGHLYLGKYRLFFLYIAGDVFLFLVFVGGLYSISQNEDSPEYLYFFMGIIMLMAYILLKILSYVGTLYQCDVLDAKTKNKPASDFRLVKNYGFTFHLWISIFSIAGIIYSSIILIFLPSSWQALAILVMWCLILVIGNSLVSKYRNVKYYEILPPCKKEKQ